MSKKTWVIISCLVLSLALGLGGSLAYLTDTDTQVNTFTMGNVDIEVEEDFVDDSELKPGLDINKDAEIVNKGSNPAYVWMTVALPKEADPAIDLIWAPGVTPVDPVEKLGTDDILYNVYTVLVNEVLAPKATTDKLLDAVRMLPNVDVQDSKYYLIENGVSTPVNYDLSKLEVIVTGYAIQQEGFNSAQEAYEAYNTQWDWENNKIPTEETPDTPGAPGTPDQPIEPDDGDDEPTVVWEEVTTLEALRAAVEDGGNVKLMADKITVTMADATIQIPENVTVVLDLNGHTLEATGTGGNQKNVIFNRGQLTITNGVMNGASQRAVIANYGQLTLEDVTVTKYKDEWASAITNSGKNKARATLTLKGNTVVNGEISNYFGDIVAGTTKVSDDGGNQAPMYTVINNDGTWSIAKQTN